MPQCSYGNRCCFPSEEFITCDHKNCTNPSANNVHQYCLLKYVKDNGFESEGYIRCRGCIDREIDEFSDEDGQSDGDTPQSRRSRVVPSSIEQKLDKLKASNEFFNKKVEKNPKKNRRIFLERLLNHHLLLSLS